MSFDCLGIHRGEFEGFLPLRAVRTSLTQIPKRPGVYVIAREHTSSPRFLKRSRAGWFKDLDPSYPVKKLEDKWVADAQVIYIGKAGPNPSRSLRRRIDELLRFGSGEDIGHRGGRALWQLQGIWDALIAWKETPDEEPRDAEKSLIAKFKSEFGVLPFANFQN